MKPFCFHLLAEADRFHASHFILPQISYSDHASAHSIVCLLDVNDLIIYVSIQIHHSYYDHSVAQLLPLAFAIVPYQCSIIQLFVNTISTNVRRNKQQKYLHLLTKLSLTFCVFCTTRHIVDKSDTLLD